MTPWTDDEMRAFVDAVSATTVDPHFALAVWNSESGLHPTAVNPHGGAQGLAQVMPQFLAGLGFSGDPLTFHQLSVAEQLPYLQRLLRNQVASLGRPPWSAEQLYHLNFFPATAHGDVVFRSSALGGNDEEDLAYRSNPGIDTQGKGYVDEDDLAALLARGKTERYAAALAQLERVALA